MDTKTATAPKGLGSRVLRDPRMRASTPSQTTRGKGQGQLNHWFLRHEKDLERESGIHLLLSVTSFGGPGGEGGSLSHGNSMRIPTSPGKPPTQTLQTALWTKAVISMRIGPTGRMRSLAWGWGWGRLCGCVHTVWTVWESAVCESGRVSQACVRCCGLCPWDSPGSAKCDPTRGFCAAVGMKRKPAGPGTQAQPSPPRPACQRPADRRTDG